MATIPRLNTSEINRNRIALAAQAPTSDAQAILNGMNALVGNAVSARRQRMEFDYKNALLEQDALSLQIRKEQLMLKNAEAQSKLNISEAERLRQDKFNEEFYGRSSPLTIETDGKRSIIGDSGDVLEESPDGVETFSGLLAEMRKGSRWAGVTPTLPGDKERSRFGAQRMVSAMSQSVTLNGLEQFGIASGPVPLSSMMQYLAQERDPELKDHVKSQLKEAGFRDPLIKSYEVESKRLTKKGQLPQMAPREGERIAGQYLTRKTLTEDEENSVGQFRSLPVKTIKDLARTAPTESRKRALTKLLHQEVAKRGQAVAVIAGDYIPAIERAVEESRLPAVDTLKEKIELLGGKFIETEDRDNIKTVSIKVFDEELPTDLPLTVLNEKDRADDGFIRVGEGVPESLDESTPATLIQRALFRRAPSTGGASGSFGGASGSFGDEGAGTPSN